MSSSNFKDIPGYPGDGDNSIELHHGDPVRWSKKATIWSISMIAVATLASIAAVVAVMNIE